MRFFLKGAVRPYSKKGAKSYRGRRIIVMPGTNASYCWEGIPPPRSSVMFQIHEERMRQSDQNEINMSL